MIEVQEQFLARASGVSRPIHLAGRQPTLLRNSPGPDFSLVSGQPYCAIRVPVHGAGFRYLYFPIERDEPDRAAAAALGILGAWLMAMAQVYLWRQGKHDGSLFSSAGQPWRALQLGNTDKLKEVFMPWNGIEAVHYKRIPNAHKFTVLGTDSSTVTFTSHSFYRPKRVARLIAERAGLPLLRG